MRSREILLVENDRDHEFLTMHALRKYGIAERIVVTRDGADALDYLFGTGDYSDTDSNQPPVLIILDLKLPKIDGIEVLRQLRLDSRTRYVPVIILTSSDEKRDVIEAYEHGANSYVCKPVDFGQFEEAVKTLGFYWLNLNQPAV